MVAPMWKMVAEQWRGRFWIVPEWPRPESRPNARREFRLSIRRISAVIQLTRLANAGESAMHTMTKSPVANHKAGFILQRWRQTSLTRSKKPASAPALSMGGYAGCSRETNNPLGFTVILFC